MRIANDTNSDELTRRVGMDDTLLLSRYVETGCQDSFEQIVARHSGWVYSLSLRAVRDRHMAEDVTQAVFIILARKASSIRAGTPLSGWLFKASRFAVSDALKRRTRMRNRENRFAEFFKATSPIGAVTGEPALAAAADDLSESLDEAVACLSESDRQAVLLRFYEGKSLAEIGAIVGISEEAAKKRVARAVERLRKYFSGRGVTTSIALLLLLLSRRTAEAAGFVPTVVAPFAAPTLAHAIAEGALKLMAHAQARLLGAIFAAGIALLISIPTLGGALAYITAPPAVAVATADSAPAISDDAGHLVTTPHLKLPEETRFADLWIAYKGELLWRSDAHTDGARNPFYLKAAEKQDRPYAVAVEPGGKFYIKPLDEAILQSPIIRQARFDYDNGPSDPTTRVHTMLSIIDPAPGEGNAAAAEPATVAPGKDAVKQLPEKHWHELKRSIDEDGTIVIEQKLRMDFDFYGPSLFGQTNLVAEVPEPAIGLFALSLAGLLTMRRPRRAKRASQAS